MRVFIAFSPCPQRTVEQNSFLLRVCQINLLLAFIEKVESIILISLPGGEIYSILIESLKKCYFCTQEGYFKL